MKIATIPASFPVFRVMSQVTYQTPRRPTAIERVLLRLCTEFGENDDVVHVPVGTLFVEMLCVPDANVLVAPCLKDLEILGVLETDQAEMTLEVPLNSLTVTARGAEMLSRGKLPGVPMTGILHHLFEPIGNIAKSALKSSSGLAPLPHVAHADPETFHTSDPTAVIRASLNTDPPAWWTKATEVDEVVCTSQETLWRERKLEVDADGTGAIRILVPSDPAVESWLRQLDGDLVWQAFLEHALFEDEGDDAPVVTLQRARSAVPRADLETVLEGGARAALRFVVGSPDDDEHAIPGKGCVVVVLEPGRRTTVVDWNDQRDGARVRLDCDAPAGFVSWWIAEPGKPPVAWTVGRVSLSWSGSRILPSLAIEADAARTADLGAPLLAALSEALSGLEDPLALALRARWEPMEIVLDAAHRRLNGLAPKPLADRATAFRTRVEAVSGGRLSPGLWDPRMQASMTAAVWALPQDLAAGQVTEVLGAIRDARVPDTAPLVAMVVDCAAPPTDLGGLHTLRAALGKSAELPMRFLTPAIGRALTEDSFSLKPRDTAGTAIERESRTARALMDGLVANLKLDLDKFDSEDAFQATLKSVRRDTVDTLGKWQTTASALRTHFPDAATLAGTRFDKLDGMFSRYQSFLSRLSDSELGVGKPVVIDTNALIDFPDLLSYLMRDEVAVLPKRVLDELDRKKSDPELGAYVGRAIHALNDAGRRVRYVEGDMALLPPDFRSSSDNLILSVAMKFRLRDPLLLTADVNLQVKARAQNIRVKLPRVLADEHAKRQPLPRKQK